MGRSREAGCCRTTVFAGTCQGARLLVVLASLRGPHKRKRSTPLPRCSLTSVHTKIRAPPLSGAHIHMPKTSCFLSQITGLPNFHPILKYLMKGSAKRNTQSAASIFDFTSKYIRRLLLITHRTVRFMAACIICASWVEIGELFLQHHLSSLFLFKADVHLILWKLCNMALLSLAHLCPG